MTLFVKVNETGLYGSPVSFVTPQASPMAGLASCFMCVDLSCLHWMESSLKTCTVFLSHCVPSSRFRVTWQVPRKPIKCMKE